MLPPRITTAATSDSDVPSAAITAAITPIRASRSASVHSCRRPAPSSRACASSPGGRPWTAAAVSAMTNGRARIDCAMNTTRLVQIRWSDPSGACGRNSTNRNAPTSTGGMARLTFASTRSTCRPRNLPRPIASPIGRPITVATAVATTATWSVNPMTLNNVGFPCRIIGTALRISSQISRTSRRPEAELNRTRALLDHGERPDQDEDHRQQHERDRGRIRIVAGVVELLEQGARERLVASLEVAADDDHRPDLRDRGAERCDHRRDHADLRFGKREPPELDATGAERPGLVEEPGRKALDRRGGQGDD